VNSSAEAWLSSSAVLGLELAKACDEKACHQDSLAAASAALP